jgi:di/tricarboxylate transporter
VQGSRDRIRLLRQNPNFIPLDRPVTPRASRRTYAIVAALSLIGLGASGVVPISTATLIAAGIVVLGGCLTPEESFQAVDWPTVVVTAGLLPLGAALQTTGAARAIAGQVVSLAGGMPLATLLAVFVATVTIGHFVSSVPTTILMAPIAIGIARTLGTNPVPYLMVISQASAVTLLTPLSHPVSLMVMGPGGYRFTDYTRVGAPLALLLAVTLLAVVLVVWPL